MNNYTIFTTYALVPNNFINGYVQAIHCNYINTLQLVTDDMSINEIRFNFQDVEDFKFLSDDIDCGTGFTASKLYLIIQIVQNVEGITSKPASNGWKFWDVTSQISGHQSGYPLSATELKSIVFKVPLNNYSNYLEYDLSYLSYPSSSQLDQLCFGDETYFFGNVTTDVKADVYVVDLSINLQLNEFNSTNNLTWDGISKVYISEVGIYDEDKNLVAIAKLNNPVPKDATISRTILFALDF